MGPEGGNQNDELPGETILYGQLVENRCSIQQDEYRALKQSFDLIIFLAYVLCSIISLIFHERLFA